MRQVSVIIPAYNRERLLPRAIASVLAQEGCRLELIVVDDGSQDGTAAVLAGYGDRLIAIHQPNAGRSAARNRGIAEARGEWLAFLDSDDAFLPGKLARQLAWHEAHPEAVLSAHGIKVEFEDGRSEDRPPRTDPTLLARAPYEAIMDGFAFFPSVIMVRRTEALAVAGFSLDYHGAEDLDFALKLARRGAVGVFSDCLTAMHQHDGQTGKAQLARENVRVLSRHLEEYELAPALRAKLRKKVARYTLSVAKRCGDRAELRGLLARAAELDPGCRLRGTYLRLRLKTLWS